MDRCDRCHSRILQDNNILNAKWCLHCSASERAQDNFGQRSIAGCRSAGDEVRNASRRLMSVTSVEACGPLRSRARSRGRRYQAIVRVSGSSARENGAPRRLRAGRQFIQSCRSPDATQAPRPRERKRFPDQKESPGGRAKTYRRGSRPRGEALGRLNRRPWRATLLIGSPCARDK